MAEYSEVVAQKNALEPLVRQKLDSMTTVGPKECKEFKGGYVLGFIRPNPQFASNGMKDFFKILKQLGANEIATTSWEIKAGVMKKYDLLTTEQLAKASDYLRSLKDLQHDCQLA